MKWGNREGVVLTPEHSQHSAIGTNTYISVFHPKMGDLVLKTLVFGLVLTVSLQYPMALWHTYTACEDKLHLASFPALQQQYQIPYVSIFVIQKVDV